MPLNIIRSSDAMPIHNIVLTIYSPPGLGKTSLAFTAEAPLCLDADNGSYRAANRKDTVRLVKWSDVGTMTAADLEPYKTIIVDTAGRALDVMSLDIISGNPKMGRSSGALSLQGFGELKGRFTGWLNFLRAQGKDVVLVCHMQEDKNGDDTLERIDAQGASKNEIYKSSDAMCRIVIQPDGSRVLNFDPREGGFGKNPAQLPRIPFPHPSVNPTFLADVITQIKAAINRMTTEQAEAIKQAEADAEARKHVLTTVQAAFEEVEGVDSFNANFLSFAKQYANTEVSQAIKDEAAKRGYTYDRKTSRFVATEAK